MGWQEDVNENFVSVSVSVVGCRESQWVATANYCGHAHITKKTQRL